MMQSTFDWLAQRLPEYRDRVIQWCEINSGTGNQDGVRKTAAAVMPLLETIADEVVARPLPRIQQTRDDGSVESLGFADALVAKKNADAPRQIFFCIHLDTVYPPDCDFQ
ncbi:MAG: hypothetical protein AAF958_15960, partial [Planctomycetota bacterium]